MSHKSLAIFVLACSLSAVFAARSCYLCNSYTDYDHTACVDPMSPYPAVNYTICGDSYLCTRVSYITQKQYVVSRGCDPAGNTCNNIYNTLRGYYPDISSFNCYTCGVNYCNGVSGLYHAAEIKNEDEKEYENGNIV
ncbi:unnamed protein product [Ceutorhynchus assimilis]|uniref:Protein sleepless n=1 Tax=Ceutorhynchus assimilis TaxID=467358 RepID=A0A9N9MVS8_9CUCU|nr:unnamed protein product [Ceutorhynchus assimilis]